MKNKHNLIVGDVIIVNSPKRLGDVHGKKGYISAHSYDNGTITAYSVTIDGTCWFILPDEVTLTNERIDPAKDMTNEHISVQVNPNGTGDLK